MRPPQRRPASRARSATHRLPLRLRMDKFMRFIRKAMRHVFRLLRKHSWGEAFMKPFLNVLLTGRPDGQRGGCTRASRGGASVTPSPQPPPRRSR